MKFAMKSKQKQIEWLEWIKAFPPYPLICESILHTVSEILKIQILLLKQFLLCKLACIICVEDTQHAEFLEFSNAAVKWYGSECSGGL